MEIGSIFQGIFGFVIQEVIAGAFDLVLWTLINLAIRSANSNGFSNVIPSLYLIFVVVLLIPVIVHLRDINDLIK